MNSCCTSVLYQTHTRASCEHWAWLLAATCPACRSLFQLASPCRVSQRGPPAWPTGRGHVYSEQAMVRATCCGDWMCGCRMDTHKSQEVYITKVLFYYSRWTMTKKYRTQAVMSVWQSHRQSEMEMLDKVQYWRRHATPVVPDLCVCVCVCVRVCSCVCVTRVVKRPALPLGGSWALYTFPLLLLWISRRLNILPVCDGEG